MYAIGTYGVSSYGVPPEEAPVPTYTIEETGVYRSPDGRESYRWTAGTVIPLEQAVRFGLPGAAEQQAAIEAEAHDGEYVRDADLDAIRAGVGPTSDRPDAAAVAAGAMYFDTTLGRPLWSDGTAWRDAAGTVVS